MSCDSIMDRAGAQRAVSARADAAKEYPKAGILGVTPALGPDRRQANTHQHRSVINSNRQVARNSWTSGWTGAWPL